MKWLTGTPPNDLRFRPTLLLALPLLMAAHEPSRTGNLLLDASAPTIHATIAGIPVLLRVDLGAHDVVEVAPSVAARLPLRWGPALTTLVGRVEVPGREAQAPLAVAGRTALVAVADHGRPCCEAADGTVSPRLLPFGTVTWQRAAAPAPTSTRRFALRWSAEYGYAASAAETPGLLLRFAPDEAVTTATAQAGARLARSWAGHWNSRVYRLPFAYGIERPVRDLAFASGHQLGGFPLASLPTRLVDFGGHDALPQEQAAPDEIVIRHRVRAQSGWPAVTLGADRLSSCRTMTLDVITATLDLQCAPGD